MSDQVFQYNINDLNLCATWYNHQKEQRKYTEHYNTCLELFNQHNKHYKRNYNHKPEFNKRLNKFISNVAFVIEHNSNNDHHHAIGLNQFSDLLEDELPFMMHIDRKDDVYNQFLYDLSENSNNLIVSMDLLRKTSLVSGDDNHNPIIEHKKSHKNKDHKINGSNTTIQPKTIKYDKYESFLDWSDPKSNPDKVNIVNKAQDQKTCGSCWAFASTGTVEASVARNIKWNMYAKALFLAKDKHKKKRKAKKAAIHVAKIAQRNVMNVMNLSVQELVDCDVDYNMGCVGGNPIASFFFIHKYGLTNASDYPYTGEEGKCNEKLVKKPIASVQSWGVLPSNHENNMKLVIRLVGPIAVGINANDPSFTSYKSGIYNSTNCNQKANHALLIVGYGEEKVKKSIIKYWIARNSWGEGWGDNGFVKIIRNNDGTKGNLGICGLAQSPSVAIGATLMNYDDDNLLPDHYITSLLQPLKDLKKKGFNQKNALLDVKNSTATDTSVKHLHKELFQSYYFVMFFISFIFAVIMLSLYGSKKKRDERSFVECKEEFGILLDSHQSYYGTSMQE